MEKIKRKQLRLDGYDYSSEGAYFITICIKEKKKILGRIDESDIDDIKVQLSEYGKAVEMQIRKINGLEKYVIMPNHIHMIILKDSSIGQSVSQLIRVFKARVSKEIGAQIFQRSFNDHIIRNEKSYNKIWEYIDTNPARWKYDCFYI